MKITYYGQSCFLVETQGKKLLFDPFISPNEMAKDIEVEKIEADYILVSHGHQDHVADLISIAQRTGAKVIGIWEVYTWLGKNGVENAHPMNIGGKWTFDFGTVKCVNAVHSATFPDGSAAEHPMGFVIWNDEGCFYFAGDTGLTLDMKLIPMTCPKLDFAILPIGDNFTMGFDDAALAADFIDCDKIVGCHFDTFGFIEIDHNAAKKVFEDRRKALILPNIGESLSI